MTTHDAFDRIGTRTTYKQRNTVSKPKLTPRPYCETCKGEGMIQIIIYHDPRDLSDFSIDIDICPECEEVNDIENEQIEKL